LLNLDSTFDEDGISARFARCRILRDSFQHRSYPTLSS
jgi:hypothetical protein